MTGPGCGPGLSPAFRKTGDGRILSDVEEVHPLSCRLSPVAPVFRGRGACVRRARVAGCYAKGLAP